MRGSLVCSAAALWAGAVGAQLDLAPAPLPPEGAGRAAGALVQDLEREIEDARAEGTARGRVAAGVRELARRLVALGDEAGEDGSVAVLTGRTLAVKCADIDIVARELTDLELDLIARDLEEEAGVIEIDADAMDRALRDTLATLAAASAEPRPSGWFDAESEDAHATDLAEAVAALATLEGIGAETAGRLVELSAVVQSAESWPAYRRDARGLAALLVRADPMRCRGTRLQASEDQLVSVFARAIDLYAEGMFRADGLLELERMAAIFEVLGLAEAEMERGRVPVLAAALVNLIEPGPDGAEQLADLRFAARALDARRRLRELVDERGIVRPIRPAVRAIAEWGRQQSTQLSGELIRLARGQAERTDPALVGLFAGLMQRVRDLESLRSLNAAIVEYDARTTEPRVRSDAGMIGVRLLRIGRSLTRASEAEAAAQELRTLAAQFVAFEHLPGEDDLAGAAARSGAPAPVVWGELTDGRAAALLDLIASQRALWVSRWTPDGEPPDAAALIALHELMAVAHDAAWSRGASRAAGTRGPRAMALQAHAAFEMSTGALHALLEGLDESVHEAVDAALAGDHERARQIAVGARRRYAAGLLIGALERQAAAMGDGPASVVMELGAGGPRPGLSWLAEQREDLADVCRYAEELPAARAEGDLERADALWAFIASRAERIRAALDTVDHPRGA